MEKPRGLGLYLAGVTFIKKKKSKMMLLSLTFFKTMFHFQSNNFFYFSNNRVYIGDLKHHFMSTHKDTCMSCKTHSPPRGLAARAQGQSIPSPRPWQLLMAKALPQGPACCHVVACTSDPLTRPSSVPSPGRCLTPRPGVVPVPPAALPLTGGWGGPWLPGTALTHPEEPPTLPVPSPREPQSPQCPDTSLSIYHRDVFSDCRFAHWVTCTTMPVFAL